MTDFSANETSHVIKLAHTLKKQRRARLAKPTHQGMVLGLFFEKQSLRTRVSFESAMAHLGGSSIFLTNADVGLGKRESVRDFAQIISRYVDILAVRTFEHKLVDELCEHATCPVINALSDEAHPCQALADIMTVQELWGKKPGKPKLAFVGDGNNVARDLAIACRQSGVDFVLAAPKGYTFDAEFLSSAQAMAGTGTIELVTAPADAVRSADFVYTDVWVSMGQEDEKKTRLKAFAQYKIDGKLMKLAKSDCYFLHCCRRIATRKFRRK